MPDLKNQEENQQVNSSTIVLSDTDFALLVTKAKAAYSNAYAPYSQFRVGAATLTNDGQVFSGCNVENASYGLTVCAERNCIGSAVVAGQQQLKTVVIYTEQEQLTPPCGACRQVISEFLTPEASVYACNHLGHKQQWRVAELLPNAFTPAFLNK